MNKLQAALPGMAISLLALLAVGCGSRCPGAEPGGGPAHRYETLELHDKYRGEEDGGGHYKTKVLYLDETARERYLLVVRDGLLYDVQGRKLDAKLGTKGNGFAIYVMDECGTIYVSFEHEAGAFHHSTLVAGGPVAAAGDLSILEGELLEISNSSGHYRPPPPYLEQAISRLKALGVDFTKVKITRIGAE